MLASVNLESAVADLKKRVGALAVAVIDREGHVLHANLPESVFPEVFGIMCATTLAAAATAGTELGRGPPRRIVVESEDAVMILAGKDGDLFLVAVVEPGGALPKQAAEVEKFVELLRNSPK